MFEVMHCIIMKNALFFKVPSYLKHHIKWILSGALIKMETREGASFSLEESPSCMYYTFFLHTCLVPPPRFCT